MSYFALQRRIYAAGAGRGSHGMKIQGNINILLMGWPKASSSPTLTGLPPEVC